MCGQRHGLGFRLDLQVVGLVSQRWSPARELLAGRLYEAQVQKERAALIESKHIALNQQVSPLAWSVTALEELAQLEQGSAQGGSPVLGVQLRPERFGQGFARVQPTFHSQVDEQGQRLARRKGERVLTVLHYWCTKQRQV